MDTFNEGAELAVTRLVDRPSPPGSILLVWDGVIDVLLAGRGGLAGYRIAVSVSP